jgi:hypothetical protein
VAFPDNDCAAPLNVTVLEFAVNEPLFTQFSLTVNVFEPVIVSDALLFMVILLQTAAAPITGWFPPEEMLTLVAAVGTVPEHQFEPVFQSVLVFPIQIPAGHDDVVTFMIPVVAAK